MLVNRTAVRRHVAAVLGDYFSSDTGTLSKSPSRSKTILIEIGPRKRPVGRPRKAPPALQVRSWWITPPLTPSRQVRALQRIAPQLRSVRMPAEGKTNWQHVVPITTRRSNIAPRQSGMIISLRVLNMRRLITFFWCVN